MKEKDKNETTGAGGIKKNDNATYILLTTEIHTIKIQDKMI